MTKGFKQTRIQISDEHQNKLADITESVYFRKRKGNGFVTNAKKVEFLIDTVYNAVCKNQEDGI